LGFGSVLGLVFGFIFGFVFGFIIGGVGVGWIEVVVVGGDGGVDGVAPSVGAEGVDVFVLSQAGGLHQGLEHVGDGASHAGFDLAADYGGDQTAQGGVEIAGREVIAGEEIG
jgi:hypothetical protein